MPEETDAELRLKQILKANPDRLSRYRAASVAFAIVPGSNEAIVFQLWFNARHAEFERDNLVP
ncbi:hypothetical protein MA20_13400 [Bradyrhizobium japonicum]|uniref:HTH Mu-type domain-containing protein n=1 Tax=Bradyrhizobium japonicum TaxID=375 RepID=A0A0A3XY74_BRAJP|nr:hypothetical protein [Bradyrhizobium japonicum]KGT79397.1 hypothetical protein MA20_13400 [Bradyrhizobium japonicum]MCS3896233.1 hypothetical protein [Bradyrhizobium japonicum USDA 38]MCS3948747.1 hypothetical protein [Bradyrhizobium japonicum]MCW2218521.1 hypothetical protein [Bradyrhizobium japonicum]MCW2343135.1 hypothetical protein [Bradyrhizobium japonicum]